MSRHVQVSPVNKIFIRSLPLVANIRNVNTKTDQLGVNYEYSNYVEETSQKKPRDPESLHVALCRTLVAAQCFGLLPVSGVTTASSTCLSFRRCSWRLMYALIVLLMCASIEVISVAHMIRVFKTSKEFMKNIGNATAGAIFYGNSCLATILFLRLARDWPRLMASWHAMEQRFGTKDFAGLTRRANITASVVMILALVEHILSMLVNMPELRDKDKTNPCPLESNLTVFNPEIGEYFKAYCCRSHAFIFSTIHYSHWTGIIIFITAKYATFAWNFQDLFVILVSSALSHRFRQINNRLRTLRGKHLRVSEWRDLRENFATISTLVQTVDEIISPIILLSFVNNLYFICLQLLNGINPDMKYWIDAAYFFGSFIFLVGRAVAVTMTAAGIHDQSRAELPSLYNCPSTSYCVEVQRLQSQMSYDDCALTGFRFFSITRNFMLAVTGAIFTYEIVLIQFK